MNSCHALPETLLAVIPSAGGDRLQVVLVRSSTSNAIELRQQSWGEGVGWFTQGCIEVTQDQFAALRQTLGIGGAMLPTEAKPSSANWQPRVISADSA